MHSQPRIGCAVVPPCELEHGSHGLFGRSLDAAHRQVRCLVRVRAAYVERSTGPLVLGPPKSRAGRRTIRYPTAIVGDIRQHLDTYTGSDPRDLVFTGAKGRPLRRGNFQKSARWREAAQSLGVGGLYFHDLRHTGNTLAAQTGASLADLMARMGHDSPRAR
jgi:integrase